MQATAQAGSSSSSSSSSSEASASSSSAAARMRASYKSPGRFSVLRCVGLSPVHRGLPVCPGQDLRNGVRVALPRQPLDQLASA